MYNIRTPNIIYYICQFNRIENSKVFQLSRVLQILDLQHELHIFDCFPLHAGAMDSFARGLLNAERILKEGVIAKQVKVHV